jgi:outer membrane lipoprotein-sorting protein
MTIGRELLKTCAAFALGCALALGAVPTLGATAAFSLEELMQKLAQVKTANGKFVERKYLRVLNEPLELRGTLAYTAPGRLEKHTLTPKPESLILVEDRLTLEDKARKQRRTLYLQDYPVLWAFVESIRSTLAGDLQSLARFYEVDLQGNERDWRLLLKPRESNIQAMVREIRIGGSYSAVRTIEVLESGGDRSVMNITEDAR